MPTYLALLLFPSQLHSRACCTSVSLTCPTTASITSSTVCWRICTSYGSSRWTTTPGSATTTSTTWSTGSSTTRASSTLAWSALSHRSSGAGASRITSRPTTGNVPRTSKMAWMEWILDREDKWGQTMTPKKWWGRRLRGRVRVCLSRWKRSPTRLRSLGWARVVWTGVVRYGERIVGSLWTDWRMD